MFKKLIYSLAIVLLASSCADTFDSVKRGLTGTKQKSTDEFLVQKKDPLILPPNFEELPVPRGGSDIKEEDSSFEKKLTKKTEDENNESPTSSSAEQSILQEIKKK